MYGLSLQIYEFGFLTSKVEKGFWEAFYSEFKTVKL